MHEIETWLNKPRRDFNEGLILISKYGASKASAGIFKRQGDNEFTLRSMEALLRSRLKHVGEEESPLSEKAVNEPALTTPAPPPAGNPKADFDQLKLAEANRLYSEMGMVHARIGSANDADRPALAAKLLELQEKWAATMYEAKYNRQPQLPKNSRIKTNAKALPGNEHAELMLLRSKVTKAQNEQIPNYQRKLASPATNSKGKKKQENIRAKMEARIKEVEQWKKRIKELEGAA